MTEASITVSTAVASSTNTRSEPDPLDLDTCSVTGMCVDEYGVFPRTIYICKSSGLIVKVIDGLEQYADIQTEGLVFPGFASEHGFEPEKKGLLVQAFLKADIRPSQIVQLNCSGPIHEQCSQRLTHLECGWGYGRLVRGYVGTLVVVEQERPFCVEQVIERGRVVKKV